MRRSERKLFPFSIGLVVLLMSFALYLSWGDSVSRETTTSPLPTKPIDQSRANTLDDSAVAETKVTILENWVSDNANSMNSFSPEGKQRMDSFVATLVPSDFVHLQKIALNSKVAANKRILATYLLTLGSLPATGSLGDFISAPLEGNPQPEPHSLDEAAMGREKAMRVMAIDHLIEKGKTDPSAIQTLRELIPSIQDPWVRSYVERRLSN